MDKHEPDNILVLGGTGYIGSAITDELLARGLRPVLLVLPGEDRRLPKRWRGKVHILIGEAARLDLLKDKIRSLDVQAVIYSIGLLRESIFNRDRFQDFHFTWAKIAIDMARRLEIQKFVYISALGAAKHGTAYQVTKFQAEEYLQKSALDWTIIRPALVLGADPRPHFMATLKRLLQLKLVPLFDGGKAEFTPVFRTDLAKVVVESLTHAEARRRVLTLTGLETVTFSELLKRVAAHYNWKYISIPLPSFLIWPLARIFRKVPLFPISDEQLTMLKQGSTAKDNTAWVQLGIKPAGIQAMLDTYKVSAE